MVRSIATLVLVAVFSNKTSFAQKPQAPVYNLILDCSCSDSVGKAYARSLRDEVAKSPRYTELADTAANRKKALQVSIVSVSIDDDSQGTAAHSAFAVAFIFDGAFVSNYVQTCGVQVTAKCAQSTLDSVDEIMSK